MLTLFFWRGGWFGPPSQSVHCHSLNNDHRGLLLGDFSPINIETIHKKFYCNSSSRLASRGCLLRPTFFQNELNIKEYDKNMYINYIFAFLLIKITTTTSNEVNLSNKWPRGRQRRHLYILIKLVTKNNENAYFSDIFW